MAAVSLDLKEPSMRHGKKGFERIRWAFRNVLVHPICWLFHNLQDEGSRIEANQSNKGIPEKFPALVDRHVS